jgi:hypothetical protein
MWLGIHISPQMRHEFAIVGLKKGPAPYEDGGYRRISRNPPLKSESELICEGDDAMSCSSCSSSLSKYRELPRHVVTWGKSATEWSGLAAEVRCCSIQNNQRSHAENWGQGSRVGGTAHIRRYCVSTEKQVLAIFQDAHHERQKHVIDVCFSPSSGTPRCRNNVDRFLLRRGQRGSASL